MSFQVGEWSSPLVQDGTAYGVVVVENAWWFEDTAHAYLGSNDPNVPTINVRIMRIDDNTITLNGIADVSFREFCRADARAFTVAAGSRLWMPEQAIYKTSPRPRTEMTGGKWGTGMGSSTEPLHTIGEGTSSSASPKGTSTDPLYVEVRDGSSEPSGSVIVRAEEPLPVEVQGIVPVSVQTPLPVSGIVGVTASSPLPVTGTITANPGATFPVSGTVSVTASQPLPITTSSPIPVSGTVGVTASSPLPVSGSVSVSASAPLPISASAAIPVSGTLSVNAASTLPVSIAGTVNVAGVVTAGKAATTQIYDQTSVSGSGLDTGIIDTSLISDIYGFAVSANLIAARALTVKYIRADNSEVDLTSLAVSLAGTTLLSIGANAAPTGVVLGVALPLPTRIRIVVASGVGTVRLTLWAKRE
jgi:hypothetical protein